MVKKDAESLLIRAAAFYDKANIEFMLEAHVDKIDRNAQLVTLSTGESLAYNKLALCTGSRVRQLPIDGTKLKGVHYLRDIADGKRD